MKDTIIQKCYGIAAMAHARGQASLKRQERLVAKYDATLDLLIDKLVNYIKDDTKRSKN